MSRRFVFMIYGTVLYAMAGVATAGGEAASAVPALPRGLGLSAQYPGDLGIAGDPTVLFFEDFEEPGMDAILGRWTDASNPGGKVMSLTLDAVPGSKGRQSLLMTATLGENEGGYLYKRLDSGRDELYVRFYVKFAPDDSYIHGLLSLGGYDPPSPWPQGGEGLRARGDEKMTVRVDPYGGRGEYPAPGIYSMYCYWSGMRVSENGRYFGNTLRPASDDMIPKGRWQCVEIMMKLNSAPDLDDGELALWIDGMLRAHFAKGVGQGRWAGREFQLVTNGGETFEGFQWRTTNGLTINFVNLALYAIEGYMLENNETNPNPVNRVWFDNLVVSGKYIGPISTY